MRILTSLMLVALAISPAAAASRTATCLSQSEAGKAWPSTWLKYRLIDGRRCWFAPGKTTAGKRAKPATARAQTIETPDDLDSVHEALCGGPCPRFDLDAPVYHALCGGPCPDFRFIDTKTIWTSARR